MNTSRTLAIVLSTGLISLAATAQTAVDHSQHATQPTFGSPVASPDGGAAPADQASGGQQLAAMDRQLQHMRDMHTKMSAAKTDQERQALMAEHKKAMHDGLRLMGGAGAASAPSDASRSGHAGHPGQSGQGGHSGHGGGMGSHMMQRHAMMEKRMEMMQATMQLMMDHMHGGHGK